MKARNYRKPKKLLLTRKQYISRKPDGKITKFTHGNTSESFEYEVTLISQNKIQILSNALEAARINSNRYLEQELGTEEYCLRILVYPHIFLRENKMIFGAHADRLQDGMRQSYGKVTLKAAKVKRNQSLIKIYVHEKGLEIAKVALKRAKMKFPGKYRIEVRKIK